jgi:cytochrome c553
MKRLAAFFSLVSVFAFVLPAHIQNAPPPWAYAVNPPDFKEPPVDATLRHIRGSTAAYTSAQLRDLFFAPDWYPDDHPPMPEIVAHGRKPNVFACGVCHRADGPGGPENSSLAGLPESYIAGWFLAAVNGTDREPIGNRIIEVPKDLDRFESRDAHSEFIIYVPLGAIAKGEALVATGGAGKTIACGTCHGRELRGLGPIPGIAGRSSSYIFRQLYDMQHGQRAGLGSAPMVTVVAKLNEEDLVSLAAYLASLTP